MKLYFENESNKLNSEFNDIKNEFEIEKEFNNIQYDENNHWIIINNMKIIFKNILLKDIKKMIKRISLYKKYDDNDEYSLYKDSKSQDTNWR